MDEILVNIADELFPHRPCNPWTRNWLSAGPSQTNLVGEILVNHPNELFWLEIDWVPVPSQIHVALGSHGKCIPLNNELYGMPRMCQWFLWIPWMLPKDLQERQTTCIAHHFMCKDLNHLNYIYTHVHFGRHDWLQNSILHTLPILHPSHISYRLPQLVCSRVLAAHGPTQQWRSQAAAPRRGHGTRDPLCQLVFSWSISFFGGANYCCCSWFALLFFVYLSMVWAPSQNQKASLTSEAQCVCPDPKFVWGSMLRKWSILKKTR